jgi:transposase
MLSLPASVKIFVYTGVTDMRRSFDRLAQMVEEHLGQNPESGHLYLFFSRRRDCVKMLLWENDGFAIWYKRLELGTFSGLAARGRRDSRPRFELAAQWRRPRALHATETIRARRHLTPTTSLPVVNVHVGSQ